MVPSMRFQLALVCLSITEASFDDQRFSRSHVVRSTVALLPLPSLPAHPVDDGDLLNSPNLLSRI